MQTSPFDSSRPRWFLSLALFVVGSILPAFTGTGIAENESFKVVVNTSNPASEITRKELSNLFLKKVTGWPGGETAKPIELAPRSSIRETFSEAIHGRPAAAIRSFWQRQIFSGRGSPPPEVSNDGAVLAFVENNKWAVGYVESGATLPSGVKSIRLLE